jgi:hypothetical protein
VTRKHLVESTLHGSMRIGCPMCTLSPMAGPMAVFASGFALGARSAVTDNAPAFCPKHDAIVSAQLALLRIGRERVEVDVSAAAEPPARPEEIPTAIAIADPTAEQQELAAWWTESNQEWHRIAQEMTSAAAERGGEAPSAHDVTVEQYRRMNDRGESPFEARRKLERLISESYRQRT